MGRPGVLQSMGSQQSDTTELLNNCWFFNGPEPGGLESTIRK